MIIYYWVWEPPMGLRYHKAGEFVWEYMLPGVEGIVLSKITTDEGLETPHVLVKAVAIDWVQWDPQLVEEAFGHWLNSLDLAVPVDCRRQEQLMRGGG